MTQEILQLDQPIGQVNMIYGTNIKEKTEVKKKQFTLPQRKKGPLSFRTPAQ